MRKYGFWFEVVVRDDERGFLSRDGRFVRLLQPGRFLALDPGWQLSAEAVKVVRAEIATERALLLHRTHPPIAEQNFEIVQAGPTEVAIVSFDRLPFRKHRAWLERHARRVLDGGYINGGTGEQCRRDECQLTRDHPELRYASSASPSRRLSEAGGEPQHPPAWRPRRDTSSWQPPWSRR